MHVSISGLYLNLELITKDWKNSRILCIEVATSGTVGRVEYSAVLYNAQVHFRTFDLLWVENQDPRTALEFPRFVVMSV
jgi:hypothetical protein